MGSPKTKTKGSMENIYSLDGKVPLLKSIPFGLQHLKMAKLALMPFGTSIV